MKNQMLFFLLLFTSVLFTQEQSLKSFDTEMFTKIEKGRYIVMNPAYQYVTQNYKAISAKENLPSNGIEDCGFAQSFENGITYTKRNCGNAFLENGEVLTIPNADRQSVLKWVEDVNKIFGKIDGNAWNFDQTEYQSVTNIFGGYFRILTENDSTKILVMSGC